MKSKLAKHKYHHMFSGGQFERNIHFVCNLKVNVSSLHLWLMKVYRHLSPKEIHFVKPFLVIRNAWVPCPLIPLVHL